MDTALSLMCCITVAYGSASTYGVMKSIEHSIMLGKQRTVSAVTEHCSGTVQYVLLQHNELPLGGAADALLHLQTLAAATDLIHGITACSFTSAASGTQWLPASFTCRHAVHSSSQTLSHKCAQLQQQLHECVTRALPVQCTGAVTTSLWP
jgi:hypothetical protein